MSAEHLRTYFEDLNDVREVAPRWVIDGFIPVGLTIVAAPPKGYKSTLTGAMAAWVSGLQCDLLPPGYRNVKIPGPVLWWSIEAKAGVLRRMMRVELHIKWEGKTSIEICSNPWAWQLDDEEGVKQLFDVLNEVQPAMVIMDPFRDTHSQDENDNRAMVQVLRPLAMWAEENNAAFLMVHHTSKPGEGHTTYKAQHMRGSGAIFGKADGVITITPDQRMANRITISATYKHGASWERQFALGAFDWPRPGIEVPDHQTMRVLEAIVKGARGLALQELSAVEDERALKESLDALVRNGWLTRIKGVPRLTKAGAQFYRNEKGKGAKRWRK